LASIAAACTLAMVVAETSPAGTIATQSLGVHYERTGFASLIARADGGLVALQGDRIETFLADGAPDPNAAPGQAPSEGKLFPVADGRTLVLGYKKLTRVNPDGGVDKSFGGTGTIKPPYGARAVYELGSGKIAVVSTESGGTHTLFANVGVELLNQDGSVDKGGGFSSSVTPLIGGIGVPEIAPTGDGGALVVGGNFLLELRADGSVNRGFGDQGVVNEEFGLVGAHILPSGLVEAVGAAPEESSGGADLALRRYTASGQPDPAFGPKGMRRFDLGGGQDEANVASWGGDGSVVVGGRIASRGPCPEEECEEAPILVAFNAAGELETGFGQGGVLRLASLAALPDGYSSEGVTAMTRRPDGSIVAAGNAPPNETVGFLAALSPQGALLSGFGEGGIVRARDPRPAEQQLAGFVPQPHGKLLAVGTTDVGIGDQPVLIRYAADSSLDRSFGGGSGYVILRGSHGGSSHGATGFAVRGDEVLTGVYDYPRSHLLLARADDGSPIASFGSAGSIELPREVRPAALAFADDGAPLVLGIQRVSGPASYEPGVVLRLRPDGRLDKAFGHGGRFTMKLSGGQVVRGKALVTGHDGRIRVGGSGGHRVALVSLLPDGRLDPRFGSGGWSITNVGNPARYLALSRAGSHIYLAGTVGEERSRQHVVLMRFDSNGRLDKSFGRRGRLVAPLTSGAHPTKIVPTRDGVLVVLSGGPRPLLTFTGNGKVRRRPVGARPQFVDNVRATVSGGRLILGWWKYDRALGHGDYYLARRPLDR
jgi:uncharacterized delta-60 repeat protein